MTNSVIHRAKRLRSPLLHRLIGTLSCIFLVGCSELAYYSQASYGQLSLLAAREDIETLLNDRNTPEPLVRKLRVVQEARRFAQQHLGLEPEANYSAYVDTGRPYVLWNITAAPRYSLSAKHWCYPVVGCQSYRGYFAQADAEAAATELSDAGWDVHVSGVAAYSTLGWFDDPVLNTFVYRSDTDLAALIFHELAHKVLYIPGDTVFNESFATAVENAGIQQWLSAQDQDTQFREYQTRFHYRQVFTELVLDTIDQLRALYAEFPSPPSHDTDLDARKQHLLNTLRETYFATTKHWNFRGYDHWFNTPLNNAKLITVANYHTYVPHFQALLIQHGHDYGKFYQAIKALSELPPNVRIVQLKNALPPDRLPHETGTTE